MSATTILSSEGMTDQDFNDFLTDCDQVVQEIQQRLTWISSGVSKLSNVQLKKFKRRYKKLWSADHVERLRLMGLGVMAPHLASPERSVKASDFKRMPQPTKDKLNNPNTIIKILTKTGVIDKPVKDMTSLELHQVVDPRKGILDVAEQRKRTLPPNPATPPTISVVEDNAGVINDGPDHMIIIAPGGNYGLRVKKTETRKFD